jgi:hypothetical protein
MAEATVSTTQKTYGAGQFRLFHLSSVASGSILTVGGGVSGWIITNRTTTDAVTATLSAGVLTITVANNPDLDVFVVSAG